MNDQNTETTGGSDEAGAETEMVAAASPRRFERPLEGRRLAGVCAAVAAYSGQSTKLIRIAFVILTLLGLAGVALYLAGWLLIPAEGEADPVAVQAWDGRHERPRRALALALVAAAVLLAAPHTLLIVGLLGAGYCLYRSDRRASPYAATR
jgi:phage shock protein C